MAELTGDVDREAEAHGPWIAAIERMPAPGQHVAFYFMGRGGCGCVEPDGKVYRWESQYPIAEFSHWMPLANPPWVGDQSKERGQ